MKSALYFLLAAVLLLTLVSGALTESDFRKMKIKDLRTFLSDRGLECVGCNEKGDFVRMAYQSRDVNVVGSAKKREVPNQSFWDAWSEVAKVECEKSVSRRGSDPLEEPFSTVCHTIQLAADSFLLQHGKRVANQLKKTPAALLKTSFKDIYYDAGCQLFQRLANQCLASPSSQEKCSSLGHVMNIMESDSAVNFKSWTTNVGIENTNPMYEIIDARDDL